MAVSISGYSVVVRNKTIDERFPGGMLAYTSLCSNRTFCTDGKVTRVSFTTLADAETFLAALAERGLTPAEKGVSVDAAVVIGFDVDTAEGCQRQLPDGRLFGTNPASLRSVSS